MHILCLPDQFVAEIRVGDINERFGFLPGGFTFQISDAIFGHHIMDVGACICDNGAVCKSRTDAGLQFTLFVLKGGGEADKALAAL